MMAATKGSQHDDGTRGGSCGGVIRSHTPHGSDNHHKSAAQGQDDTTKPATGGAGTTRTVRTLHGEVSATDESANPQTDLVIRDSLSKILAQYNSLSEITPSGVVGGKPPPQRQVPFLKRVFLLYNPHTISGWILHTLSYTFAITPLTFELLVVLTGGLEPGTLSDKVLEVTINVVILSLPAVVFWSLAQLNAARKAAQLKEHDA